MRDEGDLVPTDAPGRLLHAATLWIGRAAAAIALFAPAPATAQVVVGPDVSVQFLLEAWDVSLAILDDGTFALAGTVDVADSSPAGSHSQFEVCRYTADGQPVGAPFVPSPPGDEGSVGALGDHYVVSWRQTVRGKSFAALLGGNGEVQRGPFPWANSQDQYYSLDYRYGGPPAHTFLAVSYTQVGQDKFDNAIYAARIQAFGPQGQPLGHPAALVAKPAAVMVDDTAMAGDGRFLVVENLCHYVEDTAYRSCHEGFQIFHPSGEPETGFLTAGTPPETEADGTQNSQSLVSLGIDRGFLMIWVNSRGGGGAHPYEKLMASRFDASGRPTGEPFVLAQEQDGGIGGAEPASLADGSFALTWEPYSVEDGSSLIKVARLAPDSESAVSAIAMPRGFLAGGPYLFQVNSRGHGVVAWVAVNSFLGDQYTAHLRTIRMGGNPAAPGN